MSPRVSDTTPGGKIPSGSLSLHSLEVAQRRMALPDVSLELVWIDGRVDVIGPMSKGRPTRYAIGDRLTVLSIDPIWAAAWIGMPLRSLTDQVVDLADIDPTLAGVVLEHFANGDVRRFLSVEPSAGSHGPLSRAATAADMLSRGRRVGRVAEHLNLCERQLTRSFEALTGLHPKRFSRIARLRRAVMLAKEGAGLAAAAAAAGYADQAHLARDMRALTGQSPRQILPHVGNVQDIAAWKPEKRDAASDSQVAGSGTGDISWGRSSGGGQGFD